MRSAIILAGALSLFAPAAFADTVVVKPVPGVVVEHRSADVDTKVKTIRHDANGCTTKSVKKSDGAGDMMKHTETHC